jgi:serine-type D-Ala-D-Ala carboxypeptidase (penicillin-binding protein 5/6)
VTGGRNAGIRGAARAPRFLSAAAAALLLAGGARIARAFPFDATVSALLPSIRYARAAILVDEATGRVLFEQGADLELPPASLAKLMTLHLVYQKLAERAIDREDVVWFGPTPTPATSSRARP